MSMDIRPRVKTGPRGLGIGSVVSSRRRKKHLCWTRDGRGRRKKPYIRNRFLDLLACWPGLGRQPQGLLMTKVMATQGRYQSRRSAWPFVRHEVGFLLEID